MTNVGCVTWSLPEFGLPGTLPDGMMMHVGIQTLSQMRMLRACRVGNEQQLRQCLGCSDSRLKISAIGLNLVEDFGLNSYAGKKSELNFLNFAYTFFMWQSFWMYPPCISRVSIKMK